METLEDRCLLSAGALDPTFGVNGIVSPPASPAAALAIQTDGKMVTAGTVFSNSTTVDDFALARYNANGSLDSTFGNAGKVVTDFGKSQSWDVAFAIAIQPGDGKILVAGEHSPKFNSGGNWDMALVRYNANGSLDTGFGSGGKVTTSFTSTSQEQAAAVAVQPDGKIVIAGWVADNLTNFANSGFALARFNPNGTLDTTFGSGGRVRLRLNHGGVNEPDNGWPIRLAMQADGKLVVAGTSVDVAALVRLNSNGSLDPSFGTGGQTVASLGESNTVANALALQPDGRILVAGQAFIHVGGGSGAQAAIARFNSNGSFDNSFNSDGVLNIYASDFPGYQSSLNAIAIAADGKIIAAGHANGDPFSQNSDVLLVRVNPLDGSLDSSFGLGGIVRTAVTSGGDDAAGMALQTDGKIVVAGTCVARYLPDAPHIGSFTAIPNPVPTGGVAQLTASNFTDTNAGSTIVQVAFYLDSNGDGVLDAGDALLGYGTPSAGVWTFDFNVALASGAYTLFAQGTDSYGAVGDPVALTLTVA